MSRQGLSWGAGGYSSMYRLPNLSTTIHGIILPLVAALQREFLAGLGQVAGAVAPLDPVAEGDGELGRLEAVTAVDVPHVPQPGAGLLSHQEPVTRVSQGADGMEGLGLKILEPELLVVLETSGGQHHGLSRPDPQRDTLPFSDDPGHVPALVENQLLDRGGESHVDVPLAHVVVHHLERDPAGAVDLEPRIALRLLGLHRQEPDGVARRAAVETVGAAGAVAFLNRDLAFVGELLHEAGETAQFPGEGVDHGVGDGVEAHALEIREGLVHVIGDPEEPSGQDGVAARMFHLFQNHGAGAVVVSHDGGHSTGIPVPDYNHVDFPIPGCFHVSTSMRHRPIGDQAIPSQMNTSPGGKGRCSP